MGLVNILMNKIEEKRLKKQKENSEKVKKETKDINKYIVAYKKRIDELNNVEMPEPFSDEEKIKRYFFEIYGEEGVSHYKRYMNTREECYFEDIDKKRDFLFGLLEVHKDTGILEEKVYYMKKTIQKMQKTNSPEYSKILEDYFDAENRFSELHQGGCGMGSNGELPELPEFLRED